MLTVFYNLIIGVRECSAFPNFGQYKPEREGFEYVKGKTEEEDYYRCVKKGGNQALLPLKKILTDTKGYRKRSFRSSERDCKDCPLRLECCGKTTKFKKIEVSIHKPLYDEMHEKLTKDKNYTRFLVKRRSSTVEPVLGTLINFLCMNRVNTRGMKNANKHVLMSALSYNLKKFLKYPGRKIKAEAQMMNLQKGKVQAFFKLLSCGLHKPNLSLLKNPAFIT